MVFIHLLIIYACYQSKSDLTMDPSVILQLDKYQKKRYVFKSCMREWIIVLKKVRGTKTNEKRDSVIDKNFASFRANKLKVIDIIHKFDKKKKINKSRSSWSEEIVYEKGCVIKSCEIKTGITGNVECNHVYDKDINNVYSLGIHYFLTYWSAYHCELMPELIDNGIYCKWGPDGEKIFRYDIKNNKKNGDGIRWYKDGTIEECGKFEDNEKIGKWLYWDEGCTVMKIVDEHDHLKKAIEVSLLSADVPVDALDDAPDNASVVVSVDTADTSVDTADVSNVVVDKPLMPIISIPPPPTTYPDPIELTGMDDDEIDITDYVDNDNNADGDPDIYSHNGPFSAMHTTTL
jgi:antitoxin component YwqK of YwqJK toxin-antitoxin module